MPPGDPPQPEATGAVMEATKWLGPSVAPVTVARDIDNAEARPDLPGERQSICAAGGPGSLRQRSGVRGGVDRLFAKGRIDEVGWRSRDGARDIDRAAGEHAQRLH